ncbi:MAG: diacylglycerol kinase [Desulfobulbus sp.]|jgi:diacylglycerol kinase (ATP)
MDDPQRKANGTGLARLLRATACSYAGFVAAFRSEEAFRQEVLLCLVLLPLGCWLGDSNVERALLVASLLLLLLVEILNTSIEVVVNRISTDRHELSGLAKDLGSTAVALAILNALLVWGLVLLT